MLDFVQLMLMLAAMVVSSWLIAWAIFAVIDRLEGVRRDMEDFRNRR